MIKRILIVLLVAHCANTARAAVAASAQSSTGGVGAVAPGDPSGILLKPIPEKVVVLTFDDACISHATFVGPLLKKLGFGGTFYVTEFSKDKTRYMSWEQIKSLEDMGFEIGNHSLSHGMFSKQSVEQCTGELLGIEDLCLASHVAKPTTFCWPMYRVNKAFLPVMSARGYLFGRGGNPRFAGERAYEPAADNPFNTPSFSFHDTALQNRDAFPNAARQATPGRIVIFTFHGVPDLEHPGVGTEPARFEECMQYLKDNQYTVIAMRDMTNYVDAVRAAQPWIAAAQAGSSESRPRSSMITMDYARYLAPIDLHFVKPTKPIEGIPLGNGRMGSLVWIDGSGSKLQFNFGRPDVFYRGSATAIWANKNRTDANSTVGHVDIGFTGSPFAGTCNQDLHAYDGYERVQGADVSVRIVPWRDRDVFAIEVTDNRAEPSVITVDLIRVFQDLTTNLYSRTAVLSRQNNMLVIKQVFSEKCDTGITNNDFYCASACIVAVQGRTAAATDGQLTIPAGKGTFAIYIGSAASMLPGEDVVTSANSEVKAALATTFAAISESTAAQWHDFWSKSFIYLPATHDQPFDKSLDQHWLYYLYCMNTCQRGKYPINANGGIFNVQDGWTYWGSMYWWFNSSRQTLTPVFEQANHPELADPYFAMLSQQFPRINQAAIQQWGAGKDAIYIQETFPFDGPEILPDHIAAALKNTLVNNAGQSAPLSKLRAARSEWESRWSMGGGTCGYHTHLLYNTAEAAQWYWERYEYTRDLAWLKDRAYPMIKGAAELYRTHPLTKLEADGKYHLNNLGWAETYHSGVRDGINDLASVRGLFPVAIQSAKLLKSDAELIPLWQGMLEKLALYPTDSTPNAMGVLQTPGEPVYAIGIGSQTSPGSDHDPRMMMVSVFDLVNTESKLIKPDEWQLAMNTLAGLKVGRRVANNNYDGEPLARFIGEVARLGCAEWVKKCFAVYERYWKKALVEFPNRIREYNAESGFALDWQQEGTLCEGLSAALLQSGAASPGGTPVIRVFPAWPKDMDASFSLRAKGDFLVTSVMKSGNVDFIEMTSQRGGPCTLRNYWGRQSVDLYRNSTKSETLSAELLTFATKSGENIVIVKSGAKPADFRVSLPAARP